MYPGQFIVYSITPFLGLPTTWATEITHIQPLVYFVDEQRFGPYSLWHHQHHFREIAGGVEMTDIVHIRIPFWIIGDLAYAILVKSKLREIFSYRYKKAEEVFGAWPGQKMEIELF